MKIGEVMKAYWYEFEDGVFSFHTVQKGKDKGRVFRSNMNTWPSIAALEKGIEYKMLRNSSVDEINSWLEAHPELPVQNIIEVQ